MSKFQMAAGTTKKTLEIQWNRGLAAPTRGNLPKRSRIWRFQCSMIPEGWQQKRTGLTYWTLTRAMIALPWCNWHRGQTPITCFIGPNTPYLGSATMFCPRSPGRHCRATWNGKALRRSWWTISGRFRTNRYRNGRSRSSSPDSRICPADLIILRLLSR